MSPLRVEGRIRVERRMEETKNENDLEDWSMQISARNKRMNFSFVNLALFGQRTRREQCPVEHGGKYMNSVRALVCPSVCNAFAFWLTIGATYAVYTALLKRSSNTEAREGGTGTSPQNASRSST